MLDSSVLANGLAKPMYRCLASFHRFRVTAISARSQTTRYLAKQTFGVETKTFADYHDLLDDSTIDAVLIALPNSLHATVLQAAANITETSIF